MPLVSVILPTRDRPALLQRALASALAQTDVDLEVVLVDNNLVAPPLASTSAAGLADPRVHLVRAAHAHHAGDARNAGLVVATGEWISYLDDDDAYRPNKLARQIDLANVTGSPIVLCGACVHLRGRERTVQTRPSRGVLVGDALLNEARWNTPLLLHRRVPTCRFHSGLSAGEDAHFAQTLLAHWQLSAVPVVPAALVDIFQDVPGCSRTNLQAEQGWQAARRLWRDFGPRYSPAARRLFVLRALTARAKLRGDTRSCIALFPALLRVGGRTQLRFGLNALLVAAGLGRGRLVT